MKVKKFFSALTSCTAILLCSVFACACVGVATSTESTKQIVETQEEIKETIKQQETQEVVKEVQKEPAQMPTNNDNSVTNIDNSVTNIDNSITNIDNSVTNIDNSTIIIENGNSEDDEIILPEKKEEECVNVGNNRLIPVGDEKDDIDPNPNVVLIKNAECPKCGEHSYIEQYNKRDVYFQHYIGMCKSCNFEY